MASLAMVFVINLSDTEVRDRDYFFVTAYNFWTVWMAIGSLALINIFRKKSRILTYLIALIVIGLPIFNFASQYHIHDRSKEYIALGYGQNILNSVEQNAIVFTNGDNDTFPVWYAQAVYDPAGKEYIPPSEESQPTDVENIIYPVDVIPTEITEKNIARAMKFKNEQCYGIRKDVSIANLSLLNTPWYIKQIRDHEGIEFNIPDKHIELCQENPSSILYPRQIQKDSRLLIKGVTPEDSFTITFKKGTVLYVKDLAVLQIIKDNYGKRPIYFAVTVPDVVGFDNHLRNEGMVDRLVPTEGKNQYDLDRLTTNIDSVYSYEGIFDETIYKDHNMKRLLNNYGAAFMRASQFYHSQNDLGNAVKYIEKGLEFIQDKKRFNKTLSRLYIEASFYFIQKDSINEGFKNLEKAIYYNRKDSSILQAIYQAAVMADSHEKGIELLKKIKPYQDSVSVQTYIGLLSDKE